MQSRFGGMTRTFYSVAEHSVRVSLISPAKDALAGLLHDASEAYLKDLPAPVKYGEAAQAYRLAEEMLQAEIYARFGLAPTEPASVKDRKSTRLNSSHPSISYAV